MMDFVIFFLSVGALVYGADFVISAAERVALHFRISEFVIGATLVALGTSLPEMAASIAASAKGAPDIAVANVIGSNVMNITLVLGLTFLIAKRITPARDLFAKDSAWALFPALVFVLMVIDNDISRFNGLLLLLMMVAYLHFLIGSNKQEISAAAEAGDPPPFRWARTAASLATGFILLVGGADFAIESAGAIAQTFGISQWVIGLIMLALGTSLPELVVSIKAAFRGKADMSIGNVIGSNMANTSVVLGSAALTRHLPVATETYLFDILTMLFVTLMLVFITANRLYGKSAGIALLIILALFLEHAFVT